MSRWFIIISGRIKESTLEIKQVRPLFNFLSKLYNIYIAVLVGAVLVGIYEYYSYTHLPVDYDPTRDVIASDFFTMIIGLLQFIFIILLFINFLRFIHRTAKNLQQKYNQHMRFTPGWSIGYFFIPILNLFRPYQAVKDIWDTSGRKAHSDDSLVGIWWALWILSNVLGRAAMKYTMKNLDAGADTTSTILYLISDSLDIVLYVIEFKMVKTIATSFFRNFEENPEIINESRVTYPENQTTGEKSL